ncbi:hypothetical protein [Chitinophaga arvensicola]|uniref:Lipoprotein n=1 Tax=Chitinophaga arvensicola TaxID=29529 RepID=A0A1I0R4U5_9BACT|nr:hypothetical protein [Chitinophaga arvensicola]SEW35454.1 hypothetical protein SAMN04488122_2248 [Chitinophaga arvensicola]
MKFTNIINSIGFSIACILTSCEERGQTALVFNGNKERFTRAANLKSFLIKRVPTCYSFIFTYTGKQFWQQCDSIKPNPDIPVTFLNVDDADFLQDLMYDCDLRYIKYSPGTVQFIFRGNDPDRIVKTDSSFHDFQAFQLDSLFYLIPYNEKKPE